MDINNMTREELLQELKKDMIECQHTFKGLVIDIYWEAGKKQFISFQKGHYYKRSESEPFGIYDDNETEVCKDLYDFKEFDLCFPPKKSVSLKDNKELMDVIFGKQNMKNLENFNDQMKNMGYFK
jgi:hypothetical protein